MVKIKIKDLLKMQGVEGPKKYYIIFTYEERCFGGGKTLIRHTYETDKFSLVEAVAAMWLYLKKVNLI